MSTGHDIVVHAPGEIAAAVDPGDLEALRAGLSEVHDVVERLAAHPGRLDAAILEPFLEGIDSFPDSGSAGSGS